MILKLQKKYANGRSQWHLIDGVTEINYEETPTPFIPWLFHVTEDDPECEDANFVEMRGQPGEEFSDPDLVMVISFYQDGECEWRTAVTNAEAYLCNDSGDTLEKIPPHPGAWREKMTEPDGVMYIRKGSVEDMLADFRRNLMDQ